MIRPIELIELIGLIGLIGPIGPIGRATPRQLGEEQRGRRMRVHRTFETLRRCWRNPLIAPRLAARAPIQKTMHLADPLHLNGVAASFATLPIAAIYRDPATNPRNGRSPVFNEIRAQQTCGSLHDIARIFLADRSGSRERAEADRPQHLAAIHIADTARYILIEQDFSDRHALVDMIENAFEAFVEVGVGMTQIGSKAT